MRILVVALTALALTGCINAQQMRDTGRTAKIPLAGDYKTAASCVHRQLQREAADTDHVLSIDDARKSAAIVSYGSFNRMRWVIDIEQTGYTSSASATLPVYDLRNHDRLRMYTRNC